jgi:2-hydroxychromene-2-carboxylate isomerase
MSLRTLLMPAVTQRLLSRGRLLKARAKAERARQKRREPHRVLYFHQVDDPYSALVATCLPELLKRYDIELIAHVVGPPPDAAAPDRARLVALSRVDAQRLARHLNLPFPAADRQPHSSAVETAQRVLVAAAESGDFVRLAPALCAELWQAARADESAEADLGRWPQASVQACADHIAKAQHLREKLGHYLGATFYYAGEWYWGLDRLHHLEQRLQDLNAQRPGMTGVKGPMFAPSADLAAPVVLSKPEPIEFFFSLRSPYSAIVAPRVFELGRLTGAPVRLRFVLPMVMRGLAVPRNKRMYISLDAAREAHLRGQPFGRLNDPVGKPTERGLALIPFAQDAGKGQALVLSFMRLVWSQGVDAGSDRGLRRIVEEAGLVWADAQRALAQQEWRATAEANRQELLSLGLWGVPSFRVGALAVWGQDRLWAVQEALLGSGSANPPSLPR